MGKPTGFLEYQRTENPSSAPKERIQDYHEFHPPLSAEERQKTGGALYELRRSLLPVPPLVLKGKWLQAVLFTT